MLTTTLRKATSATVMARACTLVSPAAVANTVAMRFSSNNPFRPKGPSPMPLGDPKEQAEFERLVREFNEAPATTEHPDARSPVLPEFEGDTNPVTGEIGGPKREPVRYGEWSFGGKVVDF
ncbi:putative mitochondrial protein, conserved [Actinomortierella ambigua]|nr:putative mitochondrial protein, conserved [Actinomortierella ambigua]